MKIQLNKQTAELRKDELEYLCSGCPFNTPKYSRCPCYSDTILDCYDNYWLIIEPSDIFTL